MRVIVNITEEEYAQLKVAVKHGMGNVSDRRILNGDPYSVNDDDAIQILREISDDCFYRRNCSGCKYDIKGECGLKGLPAEWDIESVTEG